MSDCTTTKIFVSDLKKIQKYRKYPREGSQHILKRIINKHQEVD